MIYSTSFSKHIILRSFLLIIILALFFLFLPKQTNAQTFPSGLAKVPPRTIFWGQNGVFGSAARLLSNAATFGQYNQVCPPILAPLICNKYQPLYDPNKFPPKIYLQNRISGVLLSPEVWENLIAASLELVEQQQRTLLGPIVLILNLVEPKKVVIGGAPPIVVELELVTKESKPIVLMLSEEVLSEEMTPTQAVLTELVLLPEVKPTEVEPILLSAQVLTNRDFQFPAEPIPITELMQPTLDTTVNSKVNSNSTVTLTWTTPSENCQVGGCMGGCTIKSSEKSSDRQKMDVCGSGSLTIWPPSNTTTYTWDCQ